MAQTKTEKRIRRRVRIRAKVNGTSEIPRLAIFRSNKHISVQVIDDTKGNTLLYSSDTVVDVGDKKPMKEVAKLIGLDVAKKAKKMNISKIVFDRGGFTYTGNIRVLAESARKGGLIF